MKRSLDPAAHGKDDADIRLLLESLGRKQEETATRLTKLELEGNSDGDNPS